MVSSPRHNRKKARQVDKYPAKEKSFYLFCEGERTEPNYFRGFKRAIQQHPMYKNLVHIEVEGVGVETLRVLKAAEEYVEENRIVNAEIWCVYDKDSFPAADFNAVAQRAATLNQKQSDVVYRVAWSNQCIEYWFILHFDQYDSDNDREYYRQYLNRKFSSLGLGRYKKNDEKIFEILMDKGNPKLAIRRAKKRIQDCHGCTDAESKPATKVYELVQELSVYLPDDIKSNYI